MSTRQYRGKPFLLKTEKGEQAICRRCQAPIRLSREIYLVQGLAPSVTHIQMPKKQGMNLGGGRRFVLGTPIFPPQAYHVGDGIYMMKDITPADVVVFMKSMKLGASQSQLLWTYAEVMRVPRHGGIVHACPESLEAFSYVETTIIKDIDASPLKWNPTAEPTVEHQERAG